MSTTGQSAFTWIQNTNPTNAQIEQMIEKLNHRIEHSGASEDALEGSIEALDVLTQELYRRESGLEQSNLNSDAELDFGGLDQGEVNVAAKVQNPEEKASRLAQIRQAISQIEQS